MNARSGTALASGLLTASHAPPTAAVTVLAGLLAAAAGAGAGRAVLVALVFLVGQLSIGWSNDWIDAARDAANRRTDKPIARGQVGTAVVRRAALAAALVSVPLSFTLGPAAGLAHLLVVGSAWAYNLGLKSTSYSFVPYLLSFGLLPNVVTLALPDPVVAPVWATAAGALLGLGAHLANALPDLAADLATGVRGLPHRLGRRGAVLLSAAALSVASALVVLGPGGAPSVAGWVALVVALLLAVGAVSLATRSSGRLAFYATIAVALVDVVELLLSGSSLS